MRLVDTNQHNDFIHYATMSHRWSSTSDSLVLTKRSLSLLQSGIDYRQLPQSFRHAMEIAQSIHLNYIWIDALCIIKPTDDDKSDWEREGARMADIYSNSRITIAADAALNSTEGCNFPRWFPDIEPLPVPLFSEPVPREWDESQDMWFPYVHSKPPSWLHHVQDSLLGSRAWVLQERLLSPRILHCTLHGSF